MIDQKKIEKIRQMLQTEGGRYLLEYLESKLIPEYSINSNKTFEEIGREYAVCYNVNKQLKDIIKSLTKLG